MHTFREGLRAAALLEGLADRQLVTARLLEALAPQYDLCADQAALYLERAEAMRAQARRWREHVWQLWVTVESLERARGRDDSCWPDHDRETLAELPRR
jgi:hypothetical protein